MDPPPRITREPFELTDAPCRGFWVCASRRPRVEALLTYPTPRAKRSLRSRASVERGSSRTGTDEGYEAAASHRLLLQQLSHSLPTVAALVISPKTIREPERPVDGAHSARTSLP